MEEETEDAIQMCKDFIGTLGKTGSPEAIRSGLPSRGACGVDQCRITCGDGGAGRA
jgi:hypothetical protein